MDQDSRETSTALELEALARVKASRDVLDYLLQGHVGPDPWLDGAERLLRVAQRLYKQAV